MGTDKIGWFRIQKIDSKLEPAIHIPGGRVGGRLVKSDFITHSGSSDPSLDSESKFEPSVAINGLMLQMVL